MRDILDTVRFGLFVLYGAVAFLVMWLWPIFLSAGIALLFADHW